MKAEVEMESAKPENNLMNPGRLRWCRCRILLCHCGMEILKHIFHSDEKIQAPQDGQKLYNFLTCYQNQFFEIKDGHELEKLFPQSGITNEEKFDISLYGKVIIAILNYFCNNRQLSQKQLSEIKKDINVTKWLMKKRNELAHNTRLSLSSREFEEMWKEAFSFFQGYGFDMTSFRDLKDDDIFVIEKYKDIALHFLSQGRLDLFVCV